MFPGAYPGRLLDNGWLSTALNQRLGLPIRLARNATLVVLAGDLPAPVLADLLGLHIVTAVTWVYLSRRDWTGYLAACAAPSSYSADLPHHRPEP